MINRPGPELDAFEEHLLAELKTVVQVQAATTQRASAPRRAPRPWAMAVAGAAAAVAVALVVVLTRPTPAYAVSGGNGEKVTVTITRLEGAQALQDALNDRGIIADITYLPSGKACKTGRYVEIKTPGMSLATSSDKFEVTIPPGAVGEQNTFVLSAAVTPLENGVRANVQFGVAQGAVAPCTVVDAP